MTKEVAEAMLSPPNPSDDKETEKKLHPMFQKFYDRSHDRTQQSSFLTQPATDGLSSPSDSTSRMERFSSTSPSSLGNLSYDGDVEAKVEISGLKSTQATEASSSPARDQSTHNTSARPFTQKTIIIAPGSVRTSDSNEVAGDSKEIDLNEDRRKRRRTESPSPQQPCQIKVVIKTTPSSRNQNREIENVSESRSKCTSHEEGETKATAAKPRKMLQLSSKGTFETSAKPISVDASSARDNSTSRKHGRRKTSDRTTLLVKIPYRDDSEGSRHISSKIETILNSGPPAKNRRPVMTASGHSHPSKKLHPFFNSRKAEDRIVVTIPDEAAKEPENHAVGAPAPLHSSDPNSTAIVVTQKANRSPSSPRNDTTSIRVAKASKIPVTLHAIWPCQGLVHCRGLHSSVAKSSEDIAMEMTKSSDKARLLRGKSKRKQARTVENIDLLGIASERLRDLVVAEASRSRQHYPNRLLISGSKLKNIVQGNLSCGFGRDAGFANAKLSDHDSLPMRQNYIGLMDGLSRSIETTLTPFDKSRRESQAWVNKYAPRCASDVLQRGQEAYLLRDWLKGLTVAAVDVGLSASSKPEKPKKRKKPKDLDDFIVDSDDSDARMSEVDEGGNEISLSGYQKSVVRSSNASKYRNAVVISGPPGCGKSAAVYAVAKELNFEVFEINSGSKRGGKEILETVGDVAKNHLVRHEHETPSAPENAIESDDQLKSEIKAGRQKTMNGFFQTKNAKAPKSAKTPIKPPKQAQKATSIKPRRSQRQSLILFEECDVLFEEDRAFWPTVLELISNSKRPIILTCNDESLLPLESLGLHAVLRFSHPPVDIMTDYLLLIAANEGHILRKQAVQSLVQYRKSNLRGAIMDLDFWSQMGVGDRMGGLEWIFQRWPPGSDLDDEGRPVRVVSNDTFQENTVWPGSQTTKSGARNLQDEERSLETGWNEFQADMDEWLELSTAMEDSASQKRVSLEQMQCILEATSAADIHPGPALRSGTSVVLDPKTHLKSITSRHDKVEGYAELTATPLMEYDQLSQDIALCVRAQCTHMLQLEPFKPQSLQQMCSTKAPNSNVLYPVAPLSEPHPRTFPGYHVAYAEVDRSSAIVAAEVAPYIRSIARADLALANRRKALNTLLSEGGRPSKKQRTTRASRSALEGGPRQNTRRENWFGGLLKDLEAVVRTGGAGWVTQKTSTEGLHTLDQQVDGCNENDESDSSGIDM